MYHRKETRIGLGTDINRRLADWLISKSSPLAGIGIGVCTRPSGIEMPVCGEVHTLSDAIAPANSNPPAGFAPSGIGVSAPLEATSFERGKGAAGKLWPMSLGDEFWK